MEPAAGTAGGRTLLQSQKGPMAQRSGPVEAGGRALRQEEVLMFHRAASRLGEMCRVVEAGAPKT